MIQIVVLAVALSVWFLVHTALKGTKNGKGKGSNEPAKKTNITAAQLAEGVAQIPHMPSKLNNEALNCLIEAFEIIDEEKKKLLEVEHSAFCYSLLYLRYCAYINENDESKTKTFCESIMVHLIAYLYKTYGEEHFENIEKIYSLRVESYATAFETEDWFENLSDLFREYIGLSLAEDNLTMIPIISPVSYPLTISLLPKSLVQEFWKIYGSSLIGIWKAGNLLCKSFNQKLRYDLYSTGDSTPGLTDSSRRPIISPVKRGALIFR